MVADLILLCYVIMRDIMMSLSGDKQADVTDALTFLPEIWMIS